MERNPSPRPSRLVIGIGNPLRGDDGVGALLAAQAAVLAADEPDGSVTVRSVQQLTPELAEELAEVEGVLFIDAWLGTASAEPMLSAIVPTDGPGLCHQLAPGELLAICQALFQRAPEAQILLVPAYGIEHGTTLSAGLQAALPKARSLLLHWLARIGSPRADKAASGSMEAQP